MQTLEAVSECLAGCGRPPRPLLAVVVVLPFCALLPAQVTFHQDAAKALLPADAAIERLGTGLRFTEGPVWDAASKRLLFSDIPARRWLVWTAKDGIEELRPSEGANGNTLDLQRRPVSCQHDARNVVRHEVDGASTVLVDRHDGKLLNSPNDVVVRGDGTVWFTDPTYGLGKREREQAGNFVYRFDPLTGELKVVQRDFDQPNGLCFSPDQQRLYIADSGQKQRVGAFPIAADGSLGEPAFWLEGGADGIRCDATGNLWTTARDGVRVYSPTGAHLATIRLPEQPSNCAFGGDGGTWLFVTARTSLYRVQVNVAGAPVPPPRLGTEPSEVKNGGDTNAAK